MKKLLHMTLITLLLLITVACETNEDSYTVTFDTNGGSSLDEVTVFDGETVVEPTTPSKDGYSFYGWYSDSTFNIPFDFSTPIVGDITLYAKWYDAGDGEYTLTIVVDDDTNVIYNLDAGTDFESYLDDVDGIDNTELYYIDDSFTTLVTNTVMPERDITIYLKTLVEVVEMDFPTEGVVDIMMWGGSGTYYPDFGSVNSALFAYPIEAEMHAVSVAFNELYPDVVINFIAYPGGPVSGTEQQIMKLEEYKLTYGGLPSIYQTNRVTTELLMGYITDLSQYETDSRYQSINPRILELGNYYGFQTMIPKSISPWGIYINKELAELNSIDVPSPNWDIDEYTDFIQHSSPDNWYGSMGTNVELIKTGTETISMQMLDRSMDGTYVDLNSEQVRSLIPYVQDWYLHSAYKDNPDDLMMENNYWPYQFFANDNLLTLQSDPWMLYECSSSGSFGECQSDKWDYYPRPSTDFVDNTIGLIIEPLVLGNLCIDDESLTCSDQEQEQIDLAYNFMMFYLTDTRSWEAKASVGENMSHSLPITTGDLFDEQMEEWYSVTQHSRFDSPTLMPGWQEIIRIYKAGEFWDVNEGVYPSLYTDSASTKSVMYEFNSYYDAEIIGAALTETSYTDSLLNKLYTWNINTNLRLHNNFLALKESMKTYYRYTNDDFE